MTASSGNTDKVFWVTALSWSLGGLACLLALIAWGQTYDWQLWPISSYQLFPLFGVMAFGLMWSHYIAGFVRQLSGLDKEILRDYLRITGYAVLVLICLHPGLLIYSRFRDGFGLPPGSYTSYVGPGLGWVALLGTVSLFVFLAFEFHRIYGDRPWWRYVADASDFAMLAIFYHGLRLGSQLQLPWFKYVWWFYGISLTVVLARKYYLRFIDYKNQKART